MTDKPKRQDDIHDVSREAQELTPEKRATDIEELFEYWCHANKFFADQSEAPVPSKVFAAGYDVGEQHGYAVGFAKGGEVMGQGLIGVPDRARREREQLLTLGGNRPPAAPASKLENINADQLTAEICLVLTMYATLPLEVRVDAVFDALKSLGVVASRKH